MIDFNYWGRGDAGNVNSTTQKSSGTTATGVCAPRCRITAPRLGGLIIDARRHHSTRSLCTITPTRQLR
jgi:hypothetical protein